MPGRVWKKIASDILEYKGINYLMVIDYYPNRLEIKKTKGRATSEIITKLKEIFSRSGIREEIISNNMLKNET